MNLLPRVIHCIQLLSPFMPDSSDIISYLPFQSVLGFDGSVVFTLLVVLVVAIIIRVVFRKPSEQMHIPSDKPKFAPHKDPNISRKKKPNRSKRDEEDIDAIIASLDRKKKLTI
ncbi:hypothetical protein AKO1_002383 [Acrasis kona]|uniref:Uncharacterized protein n=1 Tax=Acrasis kona TaxID=1008807 RepID=A0AAW2ZRI3_9EUKA